MKITIVILILIAFAFMFYWASQLPVVYWSTSRDACVKVIVGDKIRSCDTLPTKYERIWVK